MKHRTLCLNIFKRKWPFYLFYGSEISVLAGETEDVRRGNNEYNFKASQVQLVLVFREYPLKLNLYSGEHRIGTCTVRLDRVLDAPSRDGVQVYYVVLMEIILGCLAWLRFFKLNHSPPPPKKNT